MTLRRSYQNCLIHFIAVSYKLLKGSLLRKTARNNTPAVPGCYISVTESIREQGRHGVGVVGVDEHSNAVGHRCNDAVLPDRAGIRIVRAAVSLGVDPALQDALDRQDILRCGAVRQTDQANGLIGDTDG